MDALNFVLVVIVALCIVVKEAMVGICRFFASLQSEIKVCEPEAHQVHLSVNAAVVNTSAPATPAAAAAPTAPAATPTVPAAAPSAPAAAPSAPAAAPIVPAGAAAPAVAPAAGAIPADGTSHGSTQGEERISHHMRLTASRLRAIVTCDASSKRESSRSSSPSACNSPRSPVTAAVNLRVAALRAAAAAAERAAARSSSHGASSGSGRVSYWLATSSSEDEESESDHDSQCESESEGSSPHYLRRTVSDAERRKAQAKERKQRRRGTKLFRERVPEEAVREAVRRRESADKERERVAKELRSLYPDPEQALRAMQEHGRHSARGHAAGSQWLPVTLATA